MAMDVFMPVARCLYSNPGFPSGRNQTLPGPFWYSCWALRDHVAAKLFCALPLDCASMTRHRSECGNRMGRPARNGDGLLGARDVRGRICVFAVRGARECAGAATSAEFDALACQSANGQRQL